MGEVLTLQDYAKNPKALVSGVAKLLMEDSKFLDILPIVDVGTLGIEVIQEGQLPQTIGWRDINDDHSSYRATPPGKKQERAFSFGNTLEIDKAILLDKAPKLYDPKTYQTKMITRALGRELVDALINGNPISNRKRPVGMKYRLANDLASAQTIYGNTSSTSLDLSSDAASRTANILQFFDRFDQAMYQCAEHKPDAILCNDTFRLMFNSIHRASGLLKTVTDAVGRKFTMYDDVPLVDMGFKLDDTTKIMTDTELVSGAADTGSTCSSVILVKFGPEYYTGWQEYALDVNEIPYKQSQDGLTNKIIFDWVVGVACSHPRSLVRLAGLQLT